MDDQLRSLQLSRRMTHYNYTTRRSLHLSRRRIELLPALWRECFVER